MAKPLYIRSAPPNRKYKAKSAPRPVLFARYMQRPPTIMPNYGKKNDKLGVPKTSLSRVLLYDNITQQQMLDVKIANIKIERQRAEQLFYTHRRAFHIQVEKRYQDLRKREKKARKHGHSKTESRFPPITSQGANMASLPKTPVLRQISTFSLSDVRLPDIGNHKKQILFKVKTHSGRRKVYHSYDESGIFVDLIPLYTFYPDIKDDPRFQNLEMSLISPEDEDTAGYVMLSPSYEKEYPKIPDFLLETSDSSKDRS